MMKKIISYFLFLSFTLLSFQAVAQLAVNTDGTDPDASAMLDVKSTDRGLLIPRMSGDQRNSIVSPAIGLLIYQTNEVEGFYYYNGSNWVLMGDAITNASVANLVVSDLIIQGSQCVGIDCTNSESFGFTTLKLKENNLRITFEDTSVGTFPSTDWELEANSSTNGGQNSFTIIDKTSTHRIFSMEAGAGNNAFYINDNGNTGIGLSFPLHKLHVNGNIHADGDITATGTINCASDARLKKNIQPIDHALTLVEKLEPKRYDFRVDEYQSLNLPTTPQIGLIAQKVEEVLPELVQNNMGANNGGQNFKSVNYTGLIPILLKGMQEQQAIIDQQQHELESLQAELTEMREMKQKLTTMMKVIEEETSSENNSINSVNKAYQIDSDEHALQQMNNSKQ